jgi:formate hydrogenlyase subunit 4
VNIFSIGLHLLIALLLPPLLQGVIIKTKAAFAGRVGAPLLQPYYDLIKLFQKDFIFSTTTTWVFLFGTIVTLVATLMAALLVPFGPHDVPLSFAGDAIVLFYLFALIRFFLTLSAMDVGSSFEGMGAAREVTFACLAEPTLFFGLTALATISRSLSLEKIFGSDALMKAWEVGTPSLPLIVVSWFIVLLAENSRIPFDDPNTHLELTMIHEVIVLDHAGPALGMMLYAAAMKMFLFGALLVRVAVPFTGRAWIDWPIFLTGMLAVAVLVGIVESVMARVRMPEIPKLLATACVLSALAVLLLVN